MPIIQPLVLEDIQSHTDFDLPANTFLLALKPTNNPAERHLSIILCVRYRQDDSAEYVTWLHNSYFGPGVGHYFQDLKSAMDDFNKRG